MLIFFLISISVLVVSATYKVPDRKVLKTKSKLNLDMLNRNEECELISLKWNPEVTAIY